MLTIGRALMTNPDLILIDEATEGLAPLIAQEIWRTLGVIRSEGIATIVVDKDFRSPGEDRRSHGHAVEGRDRVRRPAGRVVGERGAARDPSGRLVRIATHSLPRRGSN